MIGRIGESFMSTVPSPPSLNTFVCLSFRQNHSTELIFFFGRSLPIRIDGKCCWPANLMLIGYFSLELVLSIHWHSLINFNIHPRPLKCLAPLNQRHVQSLIPLHYPASQSTQFHYSNLSGINVIPNPLCLHSTPNWLHAGQFPFYPVDIRSRLVRCIRIGNSILSQTLLSSHRQTFHICIQREAEGDCIRGRACLLGNAV